VNYQMIGPDLNSLTMSCTLAMDSNRNADPSAYDDRRWVASPYTLDGTNVYALTIDEYQGWRHPGMCTSTLFDATCWYDSITFSTSATGGVTYTQEPAPARLVASVPYQYAANSGMAGYYTPSNIIRRGDGYYYALIDATPYQAQQAGVCVIRTNRLADPTSWRAWDGRGYTVDFVDPYTNPQPPEQHVCSPVGFEEIENMTQSLTYNTFFEEYLVVGLANFHDPDTGAVYPAIGYSTSPDLINWSERKVLMKAVVPWTYQCGDSPIIDPTVLDPLSGTRNFETTGRNVYLYFTRMNYQNCRQTLDRDLIRIPIQFIPDGTIPSGYPRPKAASPTRISLVPAYEPCATPNETHGPPLGFPSCNPPAQSSGVLTVGSPDANGAAAQATGSMRIVATAGDLGTPADEADVALSATATDVRQRNDLQDYPGELLASVALRLTDEQNGRWQSDPGTVSDVAFSFAVPCQTTASASIGSTCAAVTTADALAPGTVIEGKRAIWELGRAELFDGGPDGVAATQDNTLFEVEGVFVP
jgi:hypothetical protein